MDSRVELVAGDVLGRNRAGVGPVAGKGISEREVLAHGRVGAPLARRGLEHCDRLGRVAG